jgi:hypothetical protein
MPPGKEAREAFRRIEDDSRRAYLQQDVDLEDILPFELTRNQKEILVGLLEEWGRGQEWSECT